MKGITTDMGSRNGWSDGVTMRDKKKNNKRAGLEKGCRVVAVAIM